MLTKEAVLFSLQSVMDPEIGQNIVDLGLIYNVSVKKDGGVSVLYTLTSPACPMGETIEKNIKETLLKIPEINRADIEIELTFTPPWSPEKITAELRMEMGFGI